MRYSIDGLDVTSIGLFDLRGRLAIIPQDPAMFEGTLRDNLDPRHVHDDTELWSVLGTGCRLDAVLMILPLYSVVLTINLCRSCKTQGSCSQYGRSTRCASSGRR